MKDPRVDVIERDNDFLIRVDHLNVNKEDIDVTLSDDSITIKASIVGEEETITDGEKSRTQTSQSVFSSTTTFSCKIDDRNATSTYSDNTLKVVVPKVKKPHLHSVKTT